MVRPVCPVSRGPGGLELAMVRSAQPAMQDTAGQVHGNHWEQFHTRQPAHIAGCFYSEASESRSNPEEMHLGL